MPNSHSLISAVRQYCAICSSRQLEDVLKLPNLPITGRFSRKAMRKQPAGIDQKLLLCGNCGHGQLAYQVDPAVLYDGTYYFRTSTSQKARKGTEFFLSCFNQITGKRKFSCVLDVGCNDLHLLTQLKGRAKQRIGVDPIWKGKEQKASDPGLTVIGTSVEEIQPQHIPIPDLIVCRHTLEHIFEPRAVLERLLTMAQPEALFVFEVPGFDVLFNRLRFDQVFHEHVNYFSIASFKRLIEEVGGEYLNHWENWHDWGAFCIAFRKSKGNSQRPKTRAPYSKEDIQKRYLLFQNQTDSTCQVIDHLKGIKIFGYGAAQMLPVLGYHLKTDFAFLEAVLDDDPAKNGLYYWNLPLAIKSAKQVGDLSKVSIFMTSMDNVQPIMTKLMQNRPKNIIYPLPII